MIAMDYLIVLAICLLVVAVVIWIFYRICIFYKSVQPQRSTSTTSSRQQRWELPSTVQPPATRHYVFDEYDDRYFIRTNQLSHQPQQPRTRLDLTQWHVVHETINRPIVTVKPRVSLRQVELSKLEAVHRTVEKTPDEIYEQERKNAGEYAKKKNECFRQSKLAYKQHRKAEAKKLSNEGKKLEEKMIACNSRAADIIFQKNNPPEKPLDFVDLHGLFVKEAITKLKQRIILSKRLGFPFLTVVVGMGNHSKGEQKLKPAVIAHAKKFGIHFKVDSPNRGCIRLFFLEEE